MSKKRLKIPMSSETLHELWNGVYHKGSSCIILGEQYTHIDKVNTSDKSDGPSWDYIIERTSDGRFFKFNVWDAGEHNGYIFEDEYLIEVFPKVVTKIKYT